MKNKKGLWRPIILIVVIVAIFILARLFNLGDKLSLLRDWIESLGNLGPIVFVLIYIAAVVFALPGSVITIAAGVLFGSLLGVILVSIGSTVGAGLTFLISRYFARESISSWLSKKEKLKKLDDLSERHGAIIVAITRLVPIFPFNLLNYGFGLTKVSFWTYLFWSWICMLPGTVLYVVGTDAIFTAIKEGQAPWLLIGVIIAIIIILVALVKFARKRLKE
jgi:uncharacterized membrane protein YdjX (TVP38/TMEM64 family)